MARLRTHRRALAAGLAGVVIAIALVIGLAQSDTGATTPEHVPTLAEARADVAGAPPAIARLYAGDVPGATADGAASGGVPVLDLGRDVDRGRDRFRALLRGLRGRPVLINVWFPQCAPCVREFPVLRAAASRYGKDVAFLGLISEGSRASVDAFLRKQPTVYPHVIDRGKRIERGDLQAGLSFPNTVLIDRDGRIVDVRPAEYGSVADVERDLARLGVTSRTTGTAPTGGSAR
ncbi:TlpA family protein disulfide reductase [Patulibacter minatonensis]|uniref:TlpA family protein disulfide reductase n=1 Tax=Patulibacter minatonensis TaxID=298163 RepID=UPI00047D3BA1|nr:TlpA disulfide reductase family protein [Patulibacter minatonensis]